MLGISVEYSSLPAKNFGIRAFGSVTVTDYATPDFSQGDPPHI